MLVVQYILRSQSQHNKYALSDVRVEVYGAGRRRGALTTGSLSRHALACDPLPSWSVPRGRYATTTQESPKALRRWPSAPSGSSPCAQNPRSSAYLTPKKAANLAELAIDSPLSVRNCGVPLVSVIAVSLGFLSLNRKLFGCHSLSTLIHIPCH